MKNKKGITKRFNLVLFLYFLANNLIVGLFEPLNERNVLWDKVYNWSPIIGITGALFLLVSFVLAGAVIFKSFWKA